MRREKAVYKQAILPEHQGNPLIEALPPKRGLLDALDQFSHYPELSVDIREHTDPLVREEYTSRLRELRQPLPIYYDVYRAIDSAIKNGYSSKNPFSPTTAQYLHFPIDERPSIAPHTGFFEPRGDGITLIGESGVGKTCMLNQVLKYFPSVIEHSVYKGAATGFTNQVVWIKVDCPNNSSVRDLCEEILGQLDLAVKIEKTTPTRTIGGLVRQIEQRIKSSFLGILIIDEMQRLVFKRTGGENNLLNFLHSLVNKLGGPIFFCANPPFDETLAKTLKAARRAESEGSFTMNLLNRDDGIWDTFIEELWELQWTDIYNVLTKELNDKLFELSIGNLDMAQRIYRAAQRLIIGSGDERITIGVLEEAYAVACGLSSKTEEVRTRTIALLPRRQSRPENIHKSNSQAPGPQIEKKRVIADITRSQHPEFELQLRELSLVDDLSSQIKDPSLFLRATGLDNPTEYLREKGVMCDDPLKQFG